MLWSFLSKILYSRDDICGKDNGAGRGQVASDWTSWRYDLLTLPIQDEWMSQQWPWMMRTQPHLPLYSSILFNEGDFLRDISLYIFWCFYIDLWALFGRAQKELVPSVLKQEAAFVQPESELSPFHFLSYLSSHEAACRYIYWGSKNRVKSASVDS